MLRRIINLGFEWYFFWWSLHHVFCYDRKKRKKKKPTPGWVLGLAKTLTGPMRNWMPTQESKECLVTVVSYTWISSWFCFLIAWVFVGFTGGVIFHLGFSGSAAGKGPSGAPWRLGTTVPWSLMHAIPAAACPRRRLRSKAGCCTTA